MALFNKIIDRDTESHYPLEVELMFQYFEKEYCLDRKTVCKKLGIEPPEKKWGVVVRRENSGRRQMSEEESIEYRKRK